MHNGLRKLLITATSVLTIAGVSVAVPSSADAGGWGGWTRQTVGAEPGREVHVAGAVLPAAGAAAGVAANDFFARCADSSADARYTHFDHG